MSVVLCSMSPVCGKIKSVEPKDGFIVRSLGVTYHDGFVVTKHNHAWGQLIYSTSGVMQVVTDDVVWFVPPTRAIWVPLKCNHSIVMRGDVAMRTLYLAPGHTNSLFRDVKALEVSPLLRELVLYIHSLGMLAEGVAEHHRLAAVLTDIICNSPEGDLCLAMPRDSRAVSAAIWIQENPESHLDLKTVAEKHACSLRTLQRLFVKETGLSPDAWRQKARLIHGVTQLSCGSSVTVASLGCGYDSVSAFIAAFKKQFGVTPGRYGM
jgi:AraC-like DNA-binding protein